MTIYTTSISRHLNAPRAQVYCALLDPQAVAKWMVPDDMTSHIHEFNAQVGGSFRISLTYHELTASSGHPGKTTAHTDTYHGRFVELVPNEQVVERLAFETTDQAMSGEMTLTFTLTDANGSTDLLVVHDNLPPPLSPTDNDIGWRMALDKLAVLVAEQRKASS